MQWLARPCNPVLYVSFVERTKKGYKWKTISSGFFPKLGQYQDIPSFTPKGPAYILELSFPIVSVGDL